MGNIFIDDFRDFLAALNDQEVRYILVGGFAVILHGHPRTTGDMDIWVERSSGNYMRIKKAFAQFGMPVFDMTEQNFLSHPNWDVFTFGVPPIAIDLMVQLKGLDFDTSFGNAKLFEDDGLVIRALSLPDLLMAKRASGRNKDLDDIDNLTAQDS